MSLQLVTLGVYGFDSESFFRSLVDANVEVFCDLRLRRGMRGSTYAFVNSQQLQQKLAELGVRYLHCKKLAPSLEIRALQKEKDKELGETKRQRQELSVAFKRAYEQECLSALDTERFVEQVIGLETRVAALFCVEREPEACHRSLLANLLAQQLGLQVKHLRP